VYVALPTHNPTQNSRLTARNIIACAVDHGPHNVSRWMTWLPISLKNAAKCDNWYQLQNHSITESLNAKGAREKLSKSDPRACRISVSNNKSTRNARALLHGGDQRVQSNAGSEKK